MKKKRQPIQANNASLIIALILFVVMFIVGSIVYDHFGSLSTFLNLFNDNAYLIVVAVGETLVLLIAGIDISVSSTVAFVGVLSAWLLQAGWPALPVIILMLAIGLAIGFVIGWCVHVYNIAPFLITLAFQFLLRGLCAVVSRVSIPIEDDFYTNASLGKISIKIGGGNAKLYYYAIVAIAVVAVAWFFLKYTRFGRSIYAVGSNELSAEYMGLNVGRIKIVSYMLCEALAALGGILYSFYTLAGYNLQNMGMELDAISSAVIGGTLLTGGVGSVFGTMVGVLIQGLIQTIVTYQNLNAWWTKVTIAALLCFFILIQRAFAVRTERRKAIGQ